MSTAEPDEPVATNGAAVLPGGMAQRPHPLSPLVDSWIFLVAVVLFVGQDLIDSDWRQWLDRIQSLGWYSLIGLAALVLFPVLVAFVNWSTIRFVIDDQQVVIERSFVVRRSERVAVSKIQSVEITQPLIARLVGLAALRIDVGSQSSSMNIRYLGVKQAQHLRDYLMARARGAQVTVAKTTSDEQLLLKVANIRVLLASLVSWGSLGTGLFLVVLVVAKVMVPEQSSWLGFGLIPFLIGLAQNLFSHLKRDYNLTLGINTSGALRRSSGLTSLTSESVPLHRIQGLDITQPLLWRPFGWYRLRIEVLGEGGSDDQQQSSDLLPVGDWAEVKLLLTTIWPSLDLEQIPMRPIPKRARWFRWFDAQTYFWGADEQVLVARGFLLNNRLTIVPHARVQSVRLVQGPVQRLVKVASVEAHITPGPVSLVCRHLDAQAARELAFAETERMRLQRAKVKVSPALVENGSGSRDGCGGVPIRPVGQ